MLHPCKEGIVCIIIQIDKIDATFDIKKLKMEMNVSRLYSKRVIMERLMHVKYSFRYRLIIILANVPPWHKFFLPQKINEEKFAYPHFGQIVLFCVSKSVQNAPPTLDFD